MQKATADGRRRQVHEESSMPKVDDTVHIRFSMRGVPGPFWQTNAVIASVSGTSLLLDGFDRPAPAEVSELKSAGPGRWTLDWEVRRRP